MDLFLGIIVSALSLLLGFAIIISSMRWFTNDDIKSRMDLYVVQSAKKPAQAGARFLPRATELRGTILARVLIPFFRQLGENLYKITPGGMLQSIDRQLELAGHPYRIRLRELAGLQLLAIGIGAGVGYFIYIQRATLEFLLLGASFFILISVLPRVWIASEIAKRKKRIRLNLPDALDMLSVCTSAGLGFEQALQRVYEYWDTLLSKEFGRVINEIEMGISRRDALRNMASRLDVRELSSFVGLINQSEQMGISIAETLHAQAKQMRVERRHRAQEQAHKIPTKMLFPMAFLIFPAILAVVLGPAIPVLISFFTNF